MGPPRSVAHADAAVMSSWLALAAAQSSRITTAYEADASLSSSGPGKRKAPSSASAAAEATNDGQASGDEFVDEAAGGSESEGSGGRRAKKVRKNNGRPKKIPASVLPPALLKEKSSGVPPVWAEARQALCVTLPYFNAYQSGSYTSNGLCYGFLVDADCGLRPFLDEEVIITRAGGGMGDRDGEGRSIQREMQDTKSTIAKALVSTMNAGIPVVVIIGDKNQEAAVQLEHAYNAMAHFKITNIWFEKNGDKSFCKLRFEKLDLMDKSWWAPETSPDPLPLDQRNFVTKAPQQPCGSCGVVSPQVYSEGWMCLAGGDCPAFWKINGVDPPSITFNPAFLNERQSPSREHFSVMPPFALVPALPKQGTLDVGREGVSENSMRGIVCPQCHRCQPRVHWSGWKCETSGCGFVHQLAMPAITAESLVSLIHQYDGHAVRDTVVDIHIGLSTEYLGNYRVDTLAVVPGNSVTMFAANKAINSRVGGPSDMFVELQQADIDLQRYAMATSTLKGENLTRHFTKNFGLPYKYIASQDSSSFAGAPSVIRRAVSRLTWAGQQSVTDGTFKPFNEMLALGYLESGKIGYHDDGETTLGPTVATLSLGCLAKMTLRMKAKYYCGKTKSGKILQDDPVLPGCAKYEDRLALKALKGTLSEREYRKAEKKVFRGITYKANPPDLVTMRLKHGDMVVMNGAEMQLYYEHSVVPEGKLRFALTCRYIKPEMIAKLNPEQLSLGDLELAPEEIYDGN